MGGKHTDCVAALQKHRALSDLSRRAVLLLLLAVADITYDQDEVPCCWPGYAELGARLWGEYRPWQDSKIRSLFRELTAAGYVGRARSQHPKPKHRKACPKDSRVLHYEVYLIVEKPVQNGPESQIDTEGETGPKQTGRSQRNRSKTDQETGPKRTAPKRNATRNVTRQENATTGEATSIDGGSSRDLVEPTAFGSSIQSSNSFHNPTPDARATGHGMKIEIDHEKPQADDPEHCATCGRHMSSHTDHDLRQASMDFHPFWPGGAVSQSQYQIYRDRRLEAQRAREAEIEQRERLQREETERLRRAESQSELGPKCTICGSNEEGCRQLVGDSGHHEFTTEPGAQPPPAKRPQVPAPKAEVETESAEDRQRRRDEPAAARAAHHGPPCADCDEYEYKHTAKKARGEPVHDYRPHVLVFEDGSRYGICERCPECNQHIRKQGHRAGCQYTRVDTFSWPDRGVKMTVGPPIPLYALN